MILDGQNEFSKNQAITASANSTNVIDTSLARDIGTGEEFYIHINVTETFDDTDDNSTVAVALITDDNESLSSPATVQSLVTLPALTPAGTQLYFRVNPANLVPFQRYLGLSYTVANGNLSAGKITAGLVRNIQKADTYVASGFKVT